METKFITELEKSLQALLNHPIASFETFSCNIKNSLLMVSKLIGGFGDDVVELSYSDDDEIKEELTKIYNGLYGVCSLVDMLESSLNIDDFIKIDNVNFRYKEYKKSITNQ